MLTIKIIYSLQSAITGEKIDEYGSEDEGVSTWSRS